MKTRTPRVLVDGKEYKLCGVCGGPMSHSAYNKFRMCIHCSRLQRLGLQINEIKAKRKSQLMNEVKENNYMISLKDELTTFNPDVDYRNPLESAKEMINCKLEYDFINLYPPGITVICKDEEEAKAVLDAYTQFSNGIENIPQFNSLINGILFNTLEGHRISKKLSRGVPLTDKDNKPILDKTGEMLYKEISSSDRKDLIDLQMKLSKNTNDTSKLIEELKKTAMEDSGNVLMKEFSNMLKYHHDNKQMYTGVGICPDCNQRVHFVTNFITFNNHYLKVLKEIYDILKEKADIDIKTLDEYKKLIEKDISDDNVKEIYTVKHVRALTKALL